MAKLKSGVRSKTGHRTLEQSRGASAKYQAKPAQRKKRAMRNKARATMKKAGAKVAGKDVGHKKPLSKGGSNARSNLKVQSRKTNRGHGMTRGKKANRGK